MRNVTRNRRNRSSVKVLSAAVLAPPAILAASVFSSSAKASNLYWDQGSLNASPGSGGSGTWDTNNWWNSTTPGDQTWADGNNAIFAGAVGTVSISTSVAPSSLIFQANGYHITGGNLTAAPVSFSTPLITATIDSSVVGGGAALTMNGPGTLFLTNTGNSYGGGTNLNSGKLNVLADGALGAGSNLTFNGGTLQYGAAFSLAASRAIVLSGNGTIDTNGHDIIDANASQAMITGAGTLTLTGGAVFQSVSPGDYWTGKLYVKSGFFQSPTANSLPNPSSFTPDAVTLDGTGSTGLSVTNDASTVAGANIGLTVLGTNAQIGTSLNRDILYWEGSLTGASGTNLNVNNGTFEIASDMTDPINGTTYAGKFTVNQGGDGRGKLVIDGALNSQVGFAWGSTPAVLGGGQIVINSNNPSLTTFNAPAITSANRLAAGDGTTHAFGSDSATMPVVSGGTIAGGNGAVIPQNFTFDNNGMSVSGLHEGTVNPTGAAPVPYGDTCTFTGLITGTGDFFKEGPVYSDAYSAAGFFTTVVLAHSGNSWPGATHVDSGDLVIAANDALPVTTDVTIGGGTGKQFTIAPGVSQTVGTINTTTGYVNIDAGATLTVGNNNGNSVINILTGSGDLHVVGTGTMDVQSPQNGTTYSGNIVIDGGTLLVAGAGYIGDDDPTRSGTENTLTLQNGGTMYVTGRYNSGRHIIIGTGGGTIDENTQASTSMLFGYAGTTGPGLLTEKGSVIQLLLGGPVNLPGGIDMQGQGVIFHDYFNPSETNTVGPVTGSGQFDKQLGNNINVYSMDLSNGSMQIEAGKVTIQPRSVTGSNHTVYLNSLYMPGTTLDLNDNDLVVNSGTSYNSFSSIRANVLAGYSATPDTTKTGIISTAGQNSSGKTILALFDNALVGRADWPAGSGHTIGANAVVGKYTYYGDVNLDGQVTGDDYGAVDANLGATGLNPGNAWLMGDTNFDYKVTGDDYSAIDANLGLGVGSPLAVSSLSPVPEPASLSLIGLGLLARRRRRH